jgi:hypothetical protein
MAIQKLFSGRANSTNGSTFVGERGHIFYDETVGQLRISDGVTPGGLPIIVASTTANLGNLYVAGTSITTVVPNADLNLDSNGTGNVNIVGSIRILTSSGYYSTNPVLTSQSGAITVNGNLNANGNLITNGSTYLLGTTIFVGPTVHQGNITTTGNLIVNGSSYFAGAVTEVGNLTITGNANIAGPASYYGVQSTYGDSVFNGNLTVYGNTFNIGPTVNNGTFTQTGNILITGNSVFVVTLTGGNYGGVEITGNVMGLSQPPQNSGVMLHTTGPDGDATSGRAYFDSGGNYTVIAGRRYNGTIANPTQVLAGQDIVRYGGTPYGTGGWPTIGPARMTYTAGDNITSTAQGGYITFHTTANGTVTSNQILTATIDPAYGVTSPVGFITAGNVTVGNTFIYSTATGDAGSVTQPTNKSTSVTSNGRTGRIVMNAAALTSQNYVTFTVNNTYIRNTSDVPVVTIQNPVTTPNNYLVTVSGVAVGSFNITLFNADTGAGSTHSDAVVLNYAIIRVGS